MKHNAVAERYAGALYDLATESGQVDVVLGQLDRLRAVASATPELDSALSSAVLTNDQKKHLLATGLPDAPSLLLDFFGVVVDRHRAAHALAMAGAFRGLVERSRNIIDATVRTAVELTESEQQALGQRLNTMTRATVRLAMTVDPGIVGGLVVQFGDKRIDLSLRARLTGLRQRLLAQ